MPILAPLEEFRTQDGRAQGIDSIGKGHMMLSRVFLTGTALENGVNGVSVDPFIARQMSSRTLNRLF